MQQNSLRKRNYYTMQQAHIMLFVLLFAYVAIDLFEIMYAATTGYLTSIDFSMWIRAAVDVPVLILAFYYADAVPALKFKSTRARNIIYTLLLAFFAYVALNIFLNFLYEGMEISGVGIPENMIAENLMQSPFIISFFFLCVLAPFTEEILFRGVVQNAYERKFGFFAIVLSSMLFAFTHADILACINAFFVGLLVGYLYLKTRSIWCPIIFHAVFNLLAFTGVADVFVINLPWALGIFDVSTMTYTSHLYTMYTVAIAAACLLAVFALVRTVQIQNPYNKAVRFQEKQKGGALSIVTLVLALVLLGLRFAVGVTMYFI